MTTEKEWDTFLRKGQLRLTYEAIDDAALQKKLVNRFGQLLVENPCSNKSLFTHLRDAILPALAFRQVFEENGYTKNEILRNIHHSVQETAKPMRKMFVTMSHLPWFFSLFRALCKMSMPAKYGEDGWQFVWNENSSTKIQWDCVQCIYHDTFTKYGASELTAIFCARDDFIYGSIPGAKWARTKTIGRGAEVCDFCFYKE